MDQASNLIGNPLSLLIERVFWLLIGIFLFITITKSYFKSRNTSLENTQEMETKLKILAQKASELND